MVLSNYSDPHTAAAKHFLCDLITEIVLGEKVPEEENERVAIKLSDEKLATYVGVYRFETGGKRKITTEGGKVYYEIPPMRKGNPWTKNEITPASETLFFVPSKKSTIEFNFNHENKIIGLTVNQRFGRLKKLIKEQK